MPTQPLSYLPLLGIIILLFILWYRRESWSRPWFFAFAYFLVALFPVLGLVDHYVMHLLLCGGSFPVSGRHGTAGAGGSGIGPVGGFHYSREGRGCNQAFVRDCCWFSGY